MKTTAASALLAALSATTFTAVHAVPVVDETYPYNGPAVPIGDWVDPTINGNGKGFPRLVEAPAVQPKHKNPTNNINVISLAFLPKGINVHYQTPFGLGEAPKIKYGTDPTKLHQVATGYSHTYDRTPPCSAVAAITQCSQFFHEVQLHDLMPSTKYYYQILAANGTTESDVQSFTTSRPAGTPGAFSLAVLNDMGYTNAGGTFQQLNKVVNDGAAFAWHGGDLSYADDWYSGILPCEDDWPVCYNGTSSEVPAGDYPESYNQPLPEGENANQGGPLGGDMSVLYESNWDLWQQWMLNITTKVPYMTSLGNHEASCGEFDGPGNPLTALLDNGEINGTAPETELTYYSCPPSQRNFTAYQHRFWNPGNLTGGVGNFWYSFDYGLAHFITLDAETDYADSPSWPFARDLSGNETHPQENETYITDSGPFGRVSNYSDNKAYEQYQWLKADLEKVDRSLTPWVFVMSHRPMYSSAFSSYMTALQDAWQDLLLEYEVDAYLSGHIHWYERLFPLTADGKVMESAIVDNNTYYTVPGKTLTHLINGMAGNIESHSTLSDDESVQNITAFLDQTHYGLSKMTVFNETAVKWEFVRGDDGSIHDYLWLLKKESDTTPPDDTC